MTRFFISFGLALAIHGFFLWTDVGWYQNRSAPGPGFSPVTVTLIHPQPKDVVKHMQKAAEASFKRASAASTQPETPPNHGHLETVSESSGSLPGFGGDIQGGETLHEMAEMVVGSPFQVIQEAKPIYRNNPEPEYPLMARRRGYQGTVVLSVLVNREGRAGNLHIFQSSGHQILDKAAMDTVKKWLFEPGTKGDEKIAMWVLVPVRFELK